MIRTCWHWLIWLRSMVLCRELEAISPHLLYILFEQSPKRCNFSCFIQHVYCVTCILWKLKNWMWSQIPHISHNPLWGFKFYLGWICKFTPTQIFLSIIYLSGNKLFLQHTKLIINVPWYMYLIYVKLFSLYYQYCEVLLSFHFHLYHITWSGNNSELGGGAILRYKPYVFKESPPLHVFGVQLQIQLCRLYKYLI